MSLHRVAVFALVTVLAAPQAFAQDDDLLVPIEAKPAPRSKQKVTKKRPPKKTGSSKKPVATPAPMPQPSPEDELLVPIAPAPAKTELLVKLLGGVRGARLYVDNKDMGALTGAAVTVEPGEHTIVVRRPGFAEFTRRINVEQGKSHEVSVALDAVAGVLSVSADVPGAKVTIDGQPRGQVPLTGIELKPGPHEIVVSREGFVPEVNKLAIRAGRDYTVNAHLTPATVASTDRPERPPEPTIVPTPTPPTVTEPQVPPLTEPAPTVVSEDRPWFKRWYVWAGVGAAVAAATAGTVMATKSTTKPLSPDQVCGGPCDGTLNGIVRF
jgi:hypothetical protein